jgi:hypothetical protein
VGFGKSLFNLADYAYHSKLVVTMAKVNFDPQPGEGTVWFDYFLATDPTITSSTGPRPSSTLPPINNPQQHIQVGAIIGGVIGGLFFLLALVIFLAFCRRHNKQSHVEDFERKPDNSYSTRELTLFEALPWCSLFLQHIMDPSSRFC